MEAEVKQGVFWRAVLRLGTVITPSSVVSCGETERKPSNLGSTSGNTGLVANLSGLWGVTKTRDVVFVFGPPCEPMQAEVPCNDTPNYSRNKKEEKDRPLGGLEARCLACQPLAAPWTLHMKSLNPERPQSWAPTLLESLQLGCPQIPR